MRLGLGLAVSGLLRRFLVGLSAVLSRDTELGPTVSAVPKYSFCNTNRGETIGTSFGDVAIIFAFVVAVIGPGLLGA